MEDVVGFIKREQGETPQREYKQPEKTDVETSTEEEATEVEDTKSKSFFDKFKF